MSAAKRQRELNRAKKEHENAKLSAQIATGNVVLTNIAESVMAKLIERQAAQIEILREALGHALNGIIYYNHAKLVKRGIDAANEALSATPDDSALKAWLESYEYAELAGKMEQAAQINHLQMALADTEALEAETSARCLKQAAQIEMMREALELQVAHDKAVSYERCYDCDYATCSRENGCRGVKDHSPIASKALATTPDQALEQFAAKVRDQCFDALDPDKYPNECDKSMVYNCKLAIRAIKELPK